jgi:uncharacterized protein (UPF0335 family)
MTDPFKEDDAPLETLGDNAQQAVKSCIERIERLEEEKRVLGDNIREIYAEAKANGFNPQAMRRTVAERRRRKRMGDFDYEAEAHEIDLYLHAASGGK